jgi:hypothetical protein
LSRSFHFSFLLDKSMVSCAIWGKTCTSEFFKDYQIRSTQEYNLKSLKNSRFYVFFQTARENILLLINIMHEKIMQSLLKTPKCLFFCIISA